ncbi:putative BPI/LBP family protein [Vitis vinifera]|uniref:Putative BPI/LBP family protein n=1 Tax=Vitis vinifera TaxID=29760 RepID=A0A438BQV0_VITVI|nr:putative BPI/LBP family protein [Vitis vinifera]
MRWFNLPAASFYFHVFEELVNPDFLVIHASGSVKIAGNNLAGSVKLNDFTMSLKWSKIGNLRMFLIQPVIWTLIETVFLPYVNVHLGKGFPLPIIHGFTLQNAEIICSYSKITVCSNVAYEDPQNLNQLPFHSYRNTVML